MLRFAPLAAAAALAFLAGTPAQAQARYYSAAPVTAPADSSIVTRSTVWHCDDAVCTAGKASTRDAVMCELVVKEIGALRAFSADGTPFDADALAKCNARAE